MPIEYWILASAALLMSVIATVFVIVLFDRSTSQERTLQDLRKRLTRLQDTFTQSLRDRVPPVPPVPPVPSVPSVSPVPPPRIEPEPTGEASDAIDDKTTVSGVSNVSVSKRLPQQSHVVVARDQKHGVQGGHAGADVEERPTLESIIGERWLNWVGVITLLVGVALFLKYAYDNAWVGPLGRTVIAYVGGIGTLVAGAVGRTRGHRVVSEGVSALGFGILYAATYFAAIIYQFPWMTMNLAYGLMILTTVLGVAFSSYCRSQLLGFLTFVGGFLTPVLLSSDHDRGEELITYLVVLAIGATGLGFWLKWRSVTVLGFAASYLLFGSWFNEHYDVDRMALALTATGTFFAIFTLGSVVVPFVRREAGGAVEAGLLLTNSLVAFAFAYRILEPEHTDALAGVAFTLAILFSLLHRRLGLRISPHSPVAIVSIVLAISYLTLAVPLYFELWGIAISWAAQGVALTYLGRRYRYDWLLVGGFIALVLSADRLLDTLVERVEARAVFWTVSFWSWAFVIVALALSAWLNLRARPKQTVRKDPSGAGVAGNDGPSPPMLVLPHPLPADLSRRLSHVTGLALHAWAGVFALILGVTEIIGPVRVFWKPSGALRVFLMAGLVSVFPFAFAFPSRWAREGIRITQQVFTTLATFIPTLAFVSVVTAYRGREHEVHEVFVPVFHLWFASGSIFLLALASLGILFRTQAPRLSRTFVLGFLLGTLILTSKECHEYFLRLKWDDGVGAAWALTSLSVLWAVEASILIAIGFFFRRNTLRWAALALFGLTLSKVFLIDTSELKAVYRILAFVTLGVLLVGASFGYSRVAKREREGTQPKQRPSGS